MIQLLAQIIDLRQVVDHLAAVIDTHPEAVISAVSEVQENLERLSTLAARIEDEATLTWIIRHDGAEIHMMMTFIQGDIKALSMGTLGQLRSQEEAVLSQAAQRVHRISETLIASFNRAGTSSRDEVAAPAAYLLPEAALAPVWPILRFHCSPLHITCTPGQSPIVYHRIHTTSLLIELINALKSPLTSRIFRIDAQPSRDAYTISLLAHPFTMRPALWRWLQDRATVERLYELGGSIVPLAWDEGKGQGIVVRLPWAREIL